MMCINKVSLTVERAACPLTFKDILNYSSYFFFCLSFPCNSLVYSTQSRYSFSNFVFFFLFFVVVFTRELQKWEKMMMMMMILSYCFWPLRGRYTRQLLLSCPLVQISFLIFILDVLFFFYPATQQAICWWLYLLYFIWFLRLIKCDANCCISSAKYL